MYLFTMCASVSNMEEQKCEKSIEQDISSNDCHKSILKLDMALSLEIWDLI